MRVSNWSYLKLPDYHLKTHSGKKHTNATNNVNMRQLTQTVWGNMTKFTLEKPHRCFRVVWYFACFVLMSFTWQSWSDPIKDIVCPNWPISISKKTPNWHHILVRKQDCPKVNGNYFKYLSLEWEGGWFKLLHILVSKYM